MDEDDGVWQVPAPVMLKKLQFGSVSKLLGVSNMSILVLFWFPHCPQKVTLMSCLRGFSRWEEPPHLSHLLQGLLWLGRTTQGPSVPAPTDAHVTQDGSSFGGQCKLILKIPRQRARLTLWL